MGIKVQAPPGGKGPGPQGPKDLAGGEVPPKERRTGAPVTTPVLGEVADDSEPEEGGGITTITHKEAYLCVQTLEQISKKHDTNVKLGDEKETPMSLSDAAKLTIAAPGFSRPKWLSARQKIFGLSASSAGSSLSPAAIACSVLSGYLGKHANKM
jgi:hypothetical protein